MLFSLKNSGIIGGWFLTAGAANLIILPPETHKRDAGEKPGILLKVPDLDVHVDVSDYDDFKKFQQKRAFVDRDGKIVN